MASTTTNDKFAAIEASLREIPSSSFHELKSYSKPSLGILAIFEGVGILLDPTKEIWEWTDDKKLMSGSKEDFLQRLSQFDKNSINNQQLEKIKSILSRNDCQSSELSKISLLCAQLCLWLQAVFDYATERQNIN